jgi:hypothetical protein
VDRDRARDRADPIELARIELGLITGAFEERIERHEVVDGAQDGAVLRGDVVDEGGAAASAGSGHILHDHARVAGHVPAEVPLQQPRVKIVASARRGRHDRGDALSFIEVGDGVGAWAGRAQAAERREHNQASPALPRNGDHGTSLMRSCATSHSPHVVGIC